MTTIFSEQNQWFVEQIAVNITFLSVRTEVWIWSRFAIGFADRTALMVEKVDEIAQGSKANALGWADIGH